MSDILVAIPFPQIDPVFFRIGPLAFRWYGLMYLLGFSGLLPDQIASENKGAFVFTRPIVRSHRLGCSGRIFRWAFGLCLVL